MTPDIILDKPRIWLDFNEIVGTDKDGNINLYLFSRTDIVNDSEGKDIVLYEGMDVSVYADDLDLNNNPDALLADGIVIRNTLQNYPYVKWLIKLKKCKERYKNGNIYVYWMSNLRR